MFRKALNIAANNTTDTTGTMVATTQSTGKDTGVSLSVKKIVKVRSSVMICEDGTEATLFSPIPCLFWKCVARCDDKGIATLGKKIEGLILSADDKNYCLGINGASDEFETRMQVGKNEVRINNDFLNLMAEHVVINGLEYKE